MRNPFSRYRALVLRGLLGAALLVGTNVFAQFRVEVSGVGLTQLPISIGAFRGQDVASQRISEIVQADLERSGQFRALKATLAVMDELTRPDFSVLRQAHSDALLLGSVSKLADGHFDVRFRLWDVVKEQDLGGQSFAVSAAELRLAAHRTADYVYQKLTGDKGAFSTRIAYVTKSAQRFQLWVADADGENARAALSSPEPIISPAWSPDGNQLAYVSFESRKPVVYAHNVRTGKRRLLANFKGSNSAPAWSPDGKTLAVTLSREGGSQLFLIGANAAQANRLMQTNSIDTEPVFAPDGQSIYFVSDRGGSPQIYRVGLTGQSVERVTFTGSYNISPALSPDGHWLAYVARVAGAFKLHVMELASAQVRVISDSSADESPSFSPNGKLIVYSTHQQGHETLMTSTLDGKVKARLNGPTGDIREPAWSPYLQP